MLFSNNNNSNNNPPVLLQESSPKNSIFYKTGSINPIQLNDPSIHTDYFNIKNFIFNKDIDILGTGSLGKVYLTYNKIDNKKYALKQIIKKTLEENGININIIYREISTHLKLSHENIVKLYSYYEDKENIYIILEPVTNGTLFHKIRNENYLSESQAFHYFIQLVSAINFLHINGFIHRDIKPENILLDEKDNIKLCDFGWCINVEKYEKRTTFCGTFEYMAPEIVKDESYNSEIDIWALGILLYEMLHGYSPFRTKNPQKTKIGEEYKPIFMNILKMEYTIDKENELSPECVDMIKKLLENNSKKRMTANDIFNHPWVKKFEAKIKNKDNNIIDKKYKYKRNSRGKSRKSQKKNNKNFYKNNNNINFINDNNNDYEYNMAKTKTNTISTIDRDISKNETQQSYNNSYIEENKSSNKNNNNVDKIIDNINSVNLNIYSSNKIDVKNVDYLNIDIKNLDNFENILENARIQNGGKKTKTKSKPKLNLAQLRSNSDGNFFNYNKVVVKNNNLDFKGKYNNNNLMGFKNVNKFSIAQQKEKSPNYIGERKLDVQKKSFISYQNDHGKKEYDRKFNELTLKEIENTIKIIDESTKKKEKMEKDKQIKKQEKEESFWDKLFKPFRCDYKCDN